MYEVNEQIKLQLLDFETDNVIATLSDEVHKLKEDNNIYSIIGDYVYNVIGYNYSYDLVKDLIDKFDTNPNFEEEIHRSRVTGGRSFKDNTYMVLTTRVILTRN